MCGFHYRGNSYDCSPAAVCWAFCAGPHGQHYGGGLYRQVGTRSALLNTLAAQLWRWCQANNIVPITSYIPGEDNLIADFVSRGQCLPSEWLLNLEVFDQLRVAWAPLEINLFATTINHCLLRNCLRVRDLEALALDAFSLHWGHFRGYAFPPFPLIPQVLRNIKEDQA